MMQNANWEKKKDKMEKKKDTVRGSGRKQEKDIKKNLKYEKHEQHKGQKGGGEMSIFIVGFCSSVVVFGIYYFAMSLVLLQKAPMPEGDGEQRADKWALSVAALWDAPAVPAVLTSVFVVLITTILWVSGRRLDALREEREGEAADHIKGHLEKKQTEKEHAEKAKERRAQQVKACKEQAQRRMAVDKAVMQQAKEIAAMLRKRREEREAEEARQAKARAAAEAAAELQKEDVDEHGWTESQRRRLREAVAKYPENWSHSRKQRWDMIASEVGGGQTARTCEEMFARMAVVRAKAEGQAVSKASTDAGLGDDMDWLGGDGDTAGDFTEDEDEDEDEDDEEDESRQRMAVEVEPEHRGTEIRLENIKTMVGCATVQPEALHLQLACNDCRTSVDVYLSGADEDACAAKIWCESCSGLISARLRPTLLHAASSRLCYVDCVRCVVTDLLPSVLMTRCEACDAEVVHKQEFVRNKAISGSCQKCHASYSFRAEAIRIAAVTPCDPGNKGSRGGSSQKGGDDPMDEIEEELSYLRKKAKNDPRQQLIRLGTPLPQNGACKHFKKSYKWYRFACCGRAFPCPECHNESGCPAAALGSMATRMICGKCSMEQSYNPSRPCEKCDFIMMAKGTQHWEGGGGVRNLAAMSTKDAKKFKGGLKQSNSKTKTSSSKADRVGAKAKATREHTQKFGKDG